MRIFFAFPICSEDFAERRLLLRFRDGERWKTTKIEESDRIDIYFYSTMGGYMCMYLVRVIA